MEGSITAIAEMDMQNFPQTDPKIKAAEDKERKKKMDERRKMEAKPRKKVTRAEVNEMERLAAEATPEPEATFDTYGALRKIELYYAKLGKKIKYKPKRKPTVKSSPEELQEILFNIEQDLAIGQGIDVCTTAYPAGMAAIEQIHYKFNPLGLQLRGLGQAVEEKRDVWEDLMVEFAIKHEDWFAMGVEKRIIFFTVQVIMAVDGANRLNSALGSRQAPADVVADADDL